MRFRIVGPQRCSRFRLCLSIREILYLRKSVGQVDMGLQKIMLQPYCGLELNDCFGGLTLCSQNPSQGIVSIGTARGLLDCLFEGNAGSSEIASLQSCHSLLVGCFSGGVAAPVLRKQARYKSAETHPKQKEIAEPRKNQSVAHSFPLMAESR